MKKPLWNGSYLSFYWTTEKYDLSNYIRLHKIESRFWFQIFLDLYARVRKQNTSHEKNIIYIVDVVVTLSFNAKMVLADLKYSSSDNSCTVYVQRLLPNS